MVKILLNNDLNTSVYTIKWSKFKHIHLWRIRLEKNVPIITTVPVSRIFKICSLKIFKMKHTYSDSPYMSLKTIFSRKFFCSLTLQPKSEVKKNFFDPVRRKDYRGVPRNEKLTRNNVRRMTIKVWRVCKNWAQTYIWAIRKRIF